MNKIILMFVGSCWCVVFGLSAFSASMGSMLIALGFDESTMIYFKWIFGLAVLLGAGIPFGILAITLSRWYESMIDASTIYKRRND
ncbi:hypothetical protein DS909_22090 [Phaeobacter gallaeciensis]|uniref:Uncharacterized protein n=2 Tax=Roseobacteraceae TaxID=2854170 RepID=A0A366WKD8_9RHOB|nr:MULTISPECIES: hypothetical protein [Roseobacteraceae]MBT3141758.1 hypothetical protein [Falsiruegeria litorea]MBT8167134.1 hypothetical protein [Falsiruegeria litorea]RBW50310.1 hypothetical protein DS909_22090 [Phaeobacter gallaeciensis]